MPKKIDLRLRGITFEQAVKKMAGTLPPISKKAKAARKARRKRS
jgi:hypothetical protein